MSVAEALVEWREFYAAVAEAGGALLGLLFVAITIRLDHRPHDLHARALGMGAIVALLHPLLASLAMLLPVAGPAQGIALLMLATSGLVATTRIASFKARHPSREGRGTAAFRYVLPLVAELLLVVAALALLVDSPLGLYALPVFMALMFIVGTQDAADLLLGTTLGVHPTGELFQSSGDDAVVVDESGGRQGRGPDVDAENGAPNGSP